VYLRNVNYPESDPDPENDVYTVVLSSMIVSWIVYHL
jgi:hypothetical protein